MAEYIGATGVSHRSTLRNLLAQTVLARAMLTRQVRSRPPMQ